METNKTLSVLLKKEKKSRKMKQCNVPVKVDIASAMVRLPMDRKTHTIIKMLKVELNVLTVSLEILCLVL